MITWISLMISLSLFSLETLGKRTRKKISQEKELTLAEQGIGCICGHPVSTTSPSVSTLKFHLSSTSEVALLMITRTILCSFPFSSHSAMNGTHQIVVQDGGGERLIGGLCLRGSPTG